MNITLDDLASIYHRECEAFDLSVCSGPITDDGILPANAQELALINRYATSVRKRLEKIAVSHQFSPKQLQRAISTWKL